MKRVFLSSPDITDYNIDVAKYIAIGKYAIKEYNLMPIAPQLNIVFFDLSDETDIENAEKTSLDLVFYSNEVWVLGETITERMEHEIKIAHILKLQVKYISDSRINDIVKKYKEIA